MNTAPDPAALQALLDEAAIAKLQHRYMFALDWCDADVMASLFAEDGVLSFPEGKAEGREKIRAMVAGLAARPGRTPELRHMVSNTVVDVQGDQARARAYWFDVDKDTRTQWPYVVAYGHYEDDLVRTAGGWRFRQRIVRNERSHEEKTRLNPAW